MARLFVSDVHLDAAVPQATEQFLAFLRAEAAELLRDEVADDGLLARGQPGLPVDDVLLLPARLVRRDLAR